MEVIKKSKKALNKAVLALKKGGVVIYPTDTVYGFLADAQNKKAVDKIYKIKKRLKSKPLPIFVKDLKMANKIAFINESQAKILEKFWPGKYTFILKRKPKIKLYGVAENTIATRIPKYQFLDDLLKRTNRPLVQTSANISSKEPLKDIDKILATFGKNKFVDLIINAGVLKNAKPSKIIDLSKGKTKILRN